jgi:5-methylcytosine-specific restriction endonuclease McrA
MNTNEYYRERYRRNWKPKQVFCIDCGKDLTRHEIVQGPQKKRCPECKVKSRKRGAEILPLVCSGCGVNFTGYKNRKYCERCKTGGNIKDYVRNFFQRQRAKASGLIGNLTQRQWKNALVYFGYGCAYCGKKGRLYQDHFIPHSKGGGYTKGNIVPACPSCNSRKSGHDPREWLSKQPNGLEAYRRITQYLKGKE